MNGSVRPEAAPNEGPQVGIARYRRFRDRLVNRIDPLEAAEARRNFRRGQLALSLALVALALGAAVAETVPARSAAADALVAGLIVAMLLLATTVDVLIAGRVLMTALGIAQLLLSGDVKQLLDEGVLTEGWVSAIGILLTMLLWFTQGWLFDYGAAAGRAIAHPRRRRLCLVAFGLLFLLTGLLSAVPDYKLSDLPDYDKGVVAALQYIDAQRRSQGAPAETLHYLTAVAGAICALWAVWPRRWSAWSRPSMSGDVTLVMHAAQPRWLRHWLGRALAVFLAIYPFLIFLNGLGVTERLMVSGESRSQGGDRPVRTKRPDGEREWFWATQGRLLRAHDFTAPHLDVYAIPRERVSTLITGIGTALDQRANGLKTDQARRQSQYIKNFFEGAAGGRRAPLFYDCEFQDTLASLLRDHRLASEAAFNLAQSSEPPPEPPLWNPQPLLLVLEQPAARHDARMGPSARCHAEVFSGRPVSPRWPPTFAHFYFWQSLPLLLAGVMGFVFLWRRGGDSAVARWIGFWLIAQASTQFSSASVYTMPSMTHALDMWPPGSPVRDVLFRMMASLSVATRAMSVAVSPVDVPFCFLWVHLCWPTDARRAAWRHHAITLAKVAGAVVVLFAMRQTVLRLVSADGWGLGGELVRAAQPGILLLLLAGYVLRRWTRTRSEASDLGWLPLVAFVAMLESLPLMGLAMRRIEETVGRGPLTRPLFWVGFGLGVLALVLFVLLIRRNFMHVLSTRELNYVVTVLLLPFVLILVEDFTIEVFKESSFLSRQGAKIIGVLCVVAILPWIHRAIELGIERFFVPKLRTIEHLVYHALEAAVDQATEHDRRAEIEGTFARMGLTGYTLYARARHGVFERRLTAATAEPPAHLAMSEPLRHFLGRRKTFVDLQTVPFEWPYFFHQFELHRLERATHARYLLPICLGDSVHGFLVLPDGREEEDVCHDPVAQELGKVGVAAIHS